MGYAGQPMKVIKANRALLSKRSTLKKVNELFLDSTNTTELEFKEVSSEKLVQIKAEIRKKAEEAAWKELGVYSVCTIVVLFGLYWLFYV